MRVVLFLALLLIPLAAAHPSEDDVLLPPGSYADHTRLQTWTLEPGESRNRTVAWGGSHLQADWLYLWYGNSTGEATFTWRHDGEVVREWSWSDGDIQLITGAVPATGFYDITVTNAGDSNVTARFAYDVTCDCTAKGIEHNGGYAWFNLPAEQGDGVDLKFEISKYTFPSASPPAPVDYWTLALDRIQPTADDPRWPGDFSVIDSTTINDAQQDASFVAPDSGIHYFLAKLQYEGDPGWVFAIHPVFSIEEPGAESPGLAWLGFTGALLLVALLRRASTRD